jgi:hypothetical protein
MQYLSYTEEGCLAIRCISITGITITNNFKSYLTLNVFFPGGGFALADGNKLFYCFGFYGELQNSFIKMSLT